MRACALCRERRFQRRQRHRSRASPRCTPPRRAWQPPRDQESPASSSRSRRLGAHRGASRPLRHHQFVCARSSLGVTEWMTPRVGDFRVTGAHRRRETSSKRARCVDDARDALEPRERRRVTRLHPGSTRLARLQDRLMPHTRTRRSRPRRDVRTSHGHPRRLSRTRSLLSQRARRSSTKITPLWR